MAHRALVAYRRDDGHFALHYAHWGARLADAITPATPFGGPPPGGRDRVARDLGLDVGGGHDGATRVDPEPLRRRADPTAVLAVLDATVESLVVVEPTCEATTYLVCSLAFDGGDGGPDGGARAARLALARPDGDPAALRSRFVEAKSRVAAAIDRGAMTPAAARAALTATLRRHAAVYPPDDASFLRPD